MKKFIPFILMAGIIVMFSCTPKERSAEQAQAPIIEKPQLKLQSDIMTPEVLWSFGRISEVVVSPDQTTLLFGITYYSKEQNKGNRELYTLGVDGKNLKQITNTPFSEYGALWRPDGKKIGFMSPESGSMQLWEMNPDGSGRVKISEVADDGITGFSYSPDGKKVLYTAEVKIDKTVKDLYPDLPLSSGRVMNDIMYRHWDTWVDTYSHVFIADYDGVKLTHPVDILKDEPYESPLKPFGGMEQITWSPDSKTVAYTCRKKKGKEYSLSTNSDIYLYDIASGKTSNLTEGMMGYDVAPAYSPDGKKIAWQSMEHDGYESDKNRLFVWDSEKGTKTDYTKNFDQNADLISWSNDGKSIWFISDWHATDEIYRLDLADGKITKITDGIHDYQTVQQAGNLLIATRVSMSKPVEIYSVDPATGKDTEISFVNKDLLDQLAFGKVSKRWIKTTDNKEMLTWIIYPPHFDSTKKYPTLLYCEGGPQSTVSQFWSYRWNFQMMVAGDYIVVAPNRRGLPGFGQAWNEEISGDYGGQNMKDYLSAIDEMCKEPYVNKDKLGCIGASYGAFSVYWLAGNHHKRFKAFIAHDGMFNLEAQYLETEEMWFANWDLGGPFWDKNNKIAQRSYANSPHRFVQNWDTPILVIHSELDYRIPVTQGMQAFNAAILRGIPAEFLYFPNENHWVLKPQNGILWQRTFRSWLDRWLK
ncbi:MAG TPA: S9 family peptidase [Bacteroidales bacterium]|nr:S9 family peptidase [Bacteroidales bacterium]